MWKSKLRHFLAWSSIPPLLAIYKLVYRLAIRVAVLMFRRCRGIRAVYLTRGCSKNEITPGVSDIDFILIVNDDARQRQQAETVFHTLQILTAGLIPYHPAFLMTQEDMLYRCQSMGLWRYRLQEAKTNWSLLHGREALSALPEITGVDRTSGCCAEMNYWWAQYSDFILHSEKYRDDFVMRNSMCYKAVAEVLNARRAMETGEFCYSKDEALRREDSQLSRKLLDSAAKRFLRPDRALEEEAYRFLIASFLDMWRGFRDQPFLHVYPNVAQELDSAAAEDIQKEKLEQPFQEICRHLSDHWGAMCRGVHLVKSAFWNIEDSLLLIDADPASLPALDDLHRLIAVRERTYHRHTPAYFFLRLENVAFPLTPSLPHDFQRGVLTPATAPDVFLQLGEENVYWTSHTSWYLTDWQRNRQWRNASPLKLSQLNMIARSAAAGRVRYPLSSRSIFEPAYSGQPGT